MHQNNYFHVALRFKGREQVYYLAKTKLDTPGDFFVTSKDGAMLFDANQATDELRRIREAHGHVVQAWTQTAN